MSGNAQKTPFVRSFNDAAMQRAQAAINLLGKALPASVVAVNGSIVTVNFEIQGLPFTLPRVTMPRGGPEWAREPTQIGDKGMVFPVDYYMGGMTGLGGGIADYTQRANLATLVWFACGNTGFFSVDPDAYVIYGPNGAVLRDVSGASSLTLTPTDLTTVQPGAVSMTADTFDIEGGTSITLQAGGHSIVINSTGVIIDGKIFLLHEHTGVVSGGDNTGIVA